MSTRAFSIPFSTSHILGYPFQFCVCFLRSLGFPLVQGIRIPYRYWQREENWEDLAGWLVWEFFSFKVDLFVQLNSSTSFFPQLQISSDSRLERNLDFFD